MKERYEIETVEQLRAIADMLRLRILDLLETQAMTVTQLGERLGQAPAKIHYHVRELEKVGLLELVETREKGGILEKYYQPVAHFIAVSKTLLSHEPDESQALVRTLFDQAADGYLRTFRHFARLQESFIDAGMNMSFTHLYMTLEEQRKVQSQFYEILKPFEGRDIVEGAREVEFVTFSYPIIPSEEQPQDLEGPPAQANWAVGAVVYTRNDLLKARDAGKSLDINVIGICHFAADIEASLVASAIGSFKLVGKLIASSEVKEVLKFKEV